VQADLQQLPIAGFGEATLQSLLDIPRLHVDLPSELRPWEKDVVVLRDSVAAHDGRAMIGLKAPESPRMRANHNIREALTAREFEAGLHMLCSRDIEIRSVYNTFGGVSVRMDPNEVFELFDHPRVDYIEIPMVFTLASSLFNGAPALFEMSAQQTTPWGITMVQGPEGWSVRDGAVHCAAAGVGPPCLADDAVRELAALVRRITAHEGGDPQDVEWSFGDGQFHVLQARPITTLVDDPD
jgi:hypothetical protein